MKAKNTVLGLLAGAAMVVPMTGSLQEAAAESYMIQQADPTQDLARTRDRNGVTVLRATDEEMTNEQPVVAFSPDTKSTGLVVFMSTGRLQDETSPNSDAKALPQTNSNMQLACLPVSMVADSTKAEGVAIQVDSANAQYIFARNADDSRAGNHPELLALGKYGENELFALNAGWDRNNNANTEMYMSVLNQNCELLPLTANVTRRDNNTSAMILAKNNDNIGNGMSGGSADIYKLETGEIMFTGAFLGNGNGRDDGWNVNVRITPNATGTAVDINKLSDTSIITREERNRGSCELLSTDAEPTPEIAFCVGNEGNSQPQREGIWATVVDATTGDLMSRERIAYRGETAEGLRTYGMRPKMLCEEDVNGAKTGTCFLQYQMHRGRNNNNKKGGYDDACLMAILQPNAQGANVQSVIDCTEMIIQTGIEVTHATFFQTFDGTAENPRTVLNLTSGNHNGTGTSTRVLQMSVDTAAGTAARLSPLTLDSPFDAQKYAKYLGNNPNNQGRDYNDCQAYDNPEAANDPTLPPKVNVCVMTGKPLEADGSQQNPAIKPSVFMEVWSTMQGQVAEPAQPETGVTLPNTPDNTTEGGVESGPGGSTSGSTPGSSSPGNSVGGCSVNGGSAGGSAAFVLFGLALALRRRRRS